MLAKIKHKDAETIVSALIKQSKKLPDELYKSLTWDRGTEMAGHQQFTLATNIDCTFVIHAVHGNVDQTKTRTGCYGNIFQKALT